MKLLLVAATQSEIYPTINWLKQNSHIYTVEVLITGAGIYNTSFQLGKYFALNSSTIDLAINAGICGSFDPFLIPGTCVSVIEDCLADFGAEDDELFIHADELGLGLNSPGNSTSEIEWIKATSIDQSLILKQVRSITVNTASGNKASIERRIFKFDPQVESMEGAAFFLACHSFSIPCLQIRSVSNRVEKRNKKNWNIPLAVTSLNSRLMLIIENLNYVK